MILDKKQMTEEDIQLQYITPAIQAKWGLDRMTMETKITDGRINLKGNLITREKPKKADYVLYLTKNKPIAIVEAKDNNHSISYGLQQAITYAQMMDVPFAYSSNGDGFQEHDLLTGLERTLSMDEFPSVEELTARFECEANGGAGVPDLYTMTKRLEISLPSRARGFESHTLRHLKTPLKSEPPSSDSMVFLL